MSVKANVVVRVLVMTLVKMGARENVVVNVRVGERVRAMMEQVVSVRFCTDTNRHGSPTMSLNIRLPMTWLLNPTARLLRATARLLHLTVRLVHLTTRLVHLTARLVHLTARLFHLTARLFHLTDLMLHGAAHC